MAASHTYAVLLAGGSGTRLWPVSRELFPKQLVSFFGRDSLVQSTIKRLLPIIDGDRIRVVCGEEHVPEIARHMEEIGLSAEGHIIAEPCGRNTAPAILLAVMTLRRIDPEAVVCVFPADHVIRDVERFQERLRGAVALADEGYLVTFGIEPHYPETGYGYIEGAGTVSGGGMGIRQFVEKPDLETARGYLEAGNFYWNSGMFAFNAAVLEAEFRHHCPALFDAMERLLAAGTVSMEGYAALPNISIDYAVMEQTRKGAVLPSDFGWSDIGSWKSLYDFLPKDTDGNVVDGDVITHATQNCFIMGFERLIATNHIRNMVVVETPDSVFVSDIDTSRDVKTIVSRLKDQDREEYHRHRTVYFSWGHQTLLDRKSDHRIDRVLLYPGARFESTSPTGSVRHLILIAGTGKLSTHTGQRDLASGENAFVPEGETVQVLNDTGQALELVQIACRF